MSNMKQRDIHTLYRVCLTKTLTLFKKLFIVILCVAITFVFMCPNAASTDGLVKIVDPPTYELYSDALLTDSSSSRYAGRIWADKTVFADSVRLHSATDGYSGTIYANGGAFFLNAFSALGTSQKVNEYPPTPIDLVISMDVSSSMQSGDDSNSRISQTIRAADKLITQVLSLNPNNRVGVVLYDDNAFTLIPLDHYEIATGAADYIEGKGFADINPGVGNLDGATINGDDVDENGNPLPIYVNGCETGLPIEYSKTNTMQKETVYYNFLTVEDGYPGISWDSEADWGAENAKYYETATDNYGEGRKIIFKYKPNATKGEEYNKDKLNGEVIDNVDENVVTITQRTQGGTNIQAGYWLGLYHLAEADNAPITYTLSSGEKVQRKRTPVFMTISDGDSNYASDYSTWWMPGTVGVDTLNTFSSHSMSHDGTTTSDKFNEYNNWHGDQFSSHTIRDLKPLMTAGYWKKIVEKNYDNKLQFYTLGISLGSTRSKLVVSPHEYLMDPDLLPDDVSQSSRYTVGNVYNLAMAYISGESPRYVYLENYNEDGTLSGTTPPDDYTFFHPTNLTTEKNKGAYSLVDEKFDNNSTNYNKDPELANYFYRRYSVMKVDEPTITMFAYGEDELTTSAPTDLLQKIYYGNSAIQELDDAGYHRVKNIVGDWELEIKRNGANISIKDEPKYNIEYFKQFDITSIEDLKVNDRSYDVKDEKISQAFEEIYELIQGVAFEPVSGENDSGASDSITYADPIGQYMEIKHNGVRVGSEECDMALILFGRFRGLTRTALYSYQFNQAYLARTTGSTKGDIQPGWYSTNDPLTAVYKGQDGSFDAGDTYYLDYKTAAQFLPTLSSDVIKTPDDLSTEQKNTLYTFFRFTNDYDSRNELRWNQAYGTEPPNLIDGDRGVYKISDIRVWIEEKNSVSKTRSFGDEYEESTLFVNIPANALPLQVATITMDPTGIGSYTTNLDDTKYSRPVRLFYGVGVDHTIINAKGRIDFLKMDDDYLAAHYDGGNIEFYSNYFSDSRYEGYVTDSRADRSRGDAVVTFSPSSTNRYYAYQKNLVLYNTNDDEIKKKEDGSIDYDSVPDEQVLMDDDAYNAFVNSHSLVTNLSDLSSEDWYFVIIDYYYPLTDQPVTDADGNVIGHRGTLIRRAVPREGKEFGSGIAGDSVGAAEYLAWYSPSREEAQNFNVSMTKPTVTDGGIDDWVVATRVGGLRTGDLAQKLRTKESNDTNTARNYYIPTISINSSSGSTDNVIIDIYLGNNGKLIVPYDYNLTETGSIGATFYIILGIIFIFLSYIILRKKKGFQKIIRRIKNNIIKNSNFTN